MLKDNIKNLRKAKKLTQSELAVELNQKFGSKIERSMVSKWETGFQQPSIFTIKCLADFFGVSMDYLTENKIEESETVNITAAKVALFGGASDVTDEMWEEVYRFAQFVKQKEADKNKH